MKNVPTNLLVSSMLHPVIVGRLGMVRKMLPSILVDRTTQMLAVIVVNMI